MASVKIPAASLPCYNSRLYVSTAHKALIIYDPLQTSHTSNITTEKPISFITNKEEETQEQKTMANASDEFRLTSSSIDHEGRLPRKYTTEGQGTKRGISPPLEWYNVPDGTKTLALVAQDIDAPDPNGPLVPWTLWVVVNIPPTLKGLPEGFSGKEEEMGGEFENIKEGNNDLKVPGWRPPKMPSFGHRFEFKLYALDDEIDLGNKVTKEKLLEAIEGHVLGEAVLIAIH